MYAVVTHCHVCELYVCRFYVLWVCAHRALCVPPGMLSGYVCSVRMRRCGYVPVVMLRVRFCALFALVCALPVHRLVIVNVYGRWTETYVDLVEVFLPVMFCGVTLCSL